MIDVMFIIVSIFIAVVFILVIISIISPKFRGKLMSKQIKATKYMIDDSKEDIKDISDSMSNATKDGIETTMRAIKKGFTEDDKIYCKFCGSKIDSDSKFCKSCGKEQ